jgi:hypothetical protein
MSKILFMPLRLLTGLVAGVAARRLFARLWGLFGGEKVPDPTRRDVSVGELAGGLALQGAVFSAVRGLADHGSRAAFRRLTGVWPGPRAEARDD